MVQHATILLVEDSEDDILLMQRAFARSRLANPLHVVRDGQEAMDYLEGAGRFADRGQFPLPLIVLLDLRLPKRSGFDVLTWLRSHPELQRPTVVVLTASAQPSDYERALSLGADSYLVKPGNLSELVQLMLRIQGHWLLLPKESPPSLLEVGAGAE